MVSNASALPATPAREPSNGEAGLEFERECVDFFADVVGVLGVPRSLGQIYGLLFASSRPLSFTDIVGRLEISRGSASQGLNALRDLRAVRCVTAEGDRREMFAPELGLRQLVGGVLREKVDPLLGEGGASLKKMRVYAERMPAAGGRKFALDRVKQIETWRGQMGLLLPFLKTILGSRRG